MEKIDLIIEWLQKILIPYVGQEKCLLVWDSYEVHLSDKVLTSFKHHPHIEVAVIVGGRTAKRQPLCLSINKKFKIYWKKTKCRACK